MKIVDLSHLMNVHTPGWVGYAGNNMYYAQNLQTKMIVAQRIDTALHVGTHIDGAMHGTDGMGDMASYPLDFLVGAGRGGRCLAAHGRLGGDHAGHDRSGAGRGEGWRHPDHSHRLAALLGRPAAAGPSALFLHASRRQGRTARMDAEEEDQMVRHRLRLRRSCHEHLDPSDASRPRQVFATSSPNSIARKCGHSGCPVASSSALH